MKRYWQSMGRSLTGPAVEERLDDVTADLPYELQSKMFDQLATVSIGGAGLTVTLIGSFLRDAGPLVWLPVLLFGAAGMVAVSGNVHLIDGLFRKEDTLRRSKLYTNWAVGLIGFAVGMLSVSVYHDGKREAKTDASAAATAAQKP